jgi:hypothetical protein
MLGREARYLRLESGLGWGETHSWDGRSESVKTA